MLKVDNKDPSQSGSQSTLVFTTAHVLIFLFRYAEPASIHILDHYWPDRISVKPLRVCYRFNTLHAG